MTLRIKGGIAVTVVVALAVPMGIFYEAVVPIGYADAVGVPTDCVGETEGAKVGVQRFTWDECIARYPIRLQRVWGGLSACMNGEVTLGQGAALISWADNVGIRAACTSTLARQLNAGASGEVWCHQLMRWNKAKKFGITIELRGLTKRRESEYSMCIGTDWHISNPRPQDFSNVQSGSKP